MTDAEHDGTRPAALVALLALQDADLHVDQLRHQADHHPLRVAQRGVESDRSGIATRRTGLVSGRAALDDRQRVLEEEIEATGARIAAIEARLRSSSSGSFRDQEAMAAEIASLTARRGELEDEELAVMEELEPVDVELGSLLAADAELANEHARLGAELSVALGEIERELAVAEEHRGALSAAVPPALLEEYERLRARLGGIGAARVVRGACSGCNLALSSTELDRVRRASGTEVSHCEQCGRILVP